MLRQSPAVALTMPAAAAATATDSKQDNEQWLPVLDLAPFLAGRPGAREVLAAKLRVACEGTGFYFLEGYAALLPPVVVEGVMAASAACHTAPAPVKEGWWLDGADSGYMPVGSSTRWGSDDRPQLPVYEGVNEAALFWGNGPPWVAPAAQLPSMAANQFPMEAQLPGFRAAVERYQAAVERLAYALLPVYATALGMPPDYFDDKFTRPCWAMRLNHYPAVVGDELGIPPHADGVFCTFLLQDDQPGLSVLRADGAWVATPRRGKTSLLVNTGNVLMRLSNDAFPSTMHTASHVLPRGDATPRFSVPFFWSPSVDVEIEPLPPFVTAANPSRYERKASGSVYSSGRVREESKTQDSDRVDTRADTFVRPRRPGEAGGRRRRARAHLRQAAPARQALTLLRAQCGGVCA
jgi:isopenicillin N synthase-like dioxygenase